MKNPLNDYLTPNELKTLKDLATNRREHLRQTVHVDQAKYEVDHLTRLLAKLGAA